MVAAAMTAYAGELVVGVAGHIDHGKTALVRALTGTDTDRLPEEKARGITIELGFAALTLGDGRRASVIDMPGHERFVGTMIAGAGGVDVMLLVVAANEGVMPQTREHLAIADLVGVRGGVCALTKCDLATPDIRELAIEELREVLAGTALEGAPIVPVSAHTGEGMEALVAALTARAVAPRDASGPPVLPIDRVFVRKGFGVVVTGTLVSGTLHEGDRVACGPFGADGRLHEARVRGMQVHGTTVTEARAGNRVAINLAGVERAEVERGQWVLRPDEVALTRAFDAEVTLLPQTRRAIARRARLELAVGATRCLASVSLLQDDPLEPGHRALARITTDRPVAVRVDERMVLRGPPSLAGVGSTVGGLVAVRPVSERIRRRAVARERAARAHHGTPAVRAAVALEAVGLPGLGRAELIARAGYTVTDRAAADGIVALGGDRFVARAALDALDAKVLEALSAQHSAVPAARGLTRRDLGRLADDVALDAALDALVARRKVQRDGDFFARAGWRPRDPDAVPFLAQTHAMFVRAGLAPPRLDEVAAQVGAKSVKEVEQAVKRLVERGELEKINAELYVCAAAWADLRLRLESYLEAAGSIDAQGFKELTGQTRKYVIPYAEHFDATKVTLRIGDRRKLRGR
jgi:selenocysteine-specific elongation factor